MPTVPHQIAILGAGPAGLGAAYKLAQKGGFQVTVIEQNPKVGGNAGSFELDGVHADYGSHRLHPACDPEILADIRSLVGEDLLDRPRNGRIRLKDKWIRFPLRPVDLLLRLPPDFALGTARDMLTSPFRSKGESKTGQNFASVLERSLGKTICSEFYFPYAQKIWGSPPEELSAIQAQRRISANSPWKIIRKVFSLLPGMRKPGAGRFFYPRCGYGQISSAYEAAARRMGVEILMPARVHSIDLTRPDAVTIKVEKAGEISEIRADRLWSTIPINRLAGLIQPVLPEQDRKAVGQLEYRSMILIYLVLEQNQFSQFDAHYFPGLEIPITRLSEPKNYSGVSEPGGTTVLCAELPCGPQDANWQASDSELGELAVEALAKEGIPVQSPIRSILVKRLRYAYPIYRQGFESHFSLLDDWISQFERVLSFGRQGLFAHDNTHHALYTAYSAVECLDPSGRFDHDRWTEYRRIFETHVVED